jgi:hypothetical protein
MTCSYTQNFFNEICKALSCKLWKGF